MAREKSRESTAMQRVDNTKQLLLCKLFCPVRSDAAKKKSPESKAKQRTIEKKMKKLQVAPKP